MIGIGDWATIVVIVERILGTVDWLWDDGESDNAIQWLFRLRIFKFIVLEVNCQMVVQKNGVLVDLAQFVSMLVLNFVSFIWMFKKKL